MLIGLRSRAASSVGAVLLAVGCLLPAQPAAAQTFDPSFTEYRMTEGLSNSSVKALLQDRAGFIWIGTQGGLDRFSGVGFDAFRARADDPGSLADDYVEALALATDGRIWVGTRAAGVELLDPVTRQVRHFPLFEVGSGTDAPPSTASARPRRSVTEIVPMEDGSVLLSTDVGLARLWPSEDSVALVLASGDGRALAPTALCQEDRRSALAALADGSLARIEASGVTRLSVHFPDSLAALDCRTSQVHAGTFDGRVFEVDIASGRAELVTEAVSEGHLRALHVDPDGRIWLATTSGLFVADQPGRPAIRIGGEESGHPLPDQETTALLRDRSGVLWIGSWGGLASIHPLNATFGRVRAGVDYDGPGVVAIGESPDSVFWLGTMGAGVHRMTFRAEASAVEITSPTALRPLENASVFGLAEAGETLWIAAFDRGIWRYEAPGTLDRIPVFDDTGNEVPGVYAYSVFTDTSGTVWAGTAPAGLLRLDESGQSFRPQLTTTDLGGSDWVWPIVEGAEGTLWLGAFEAGLVRLSPDRTDSRVYRAGPNGLSSDRILTLFVDSRGGVWIGTEGGGLNHLDPVTGTFEVYRVEDGLPNDHVEAIAEDLHGLLWVTTNSGLVRLDPATGHFLVFREKAGLTGDRFYANSILATSRGDLLAGGPAGLTIVDPAAIEARSAPPTVSLTGFRIQGEDGGLGRALAPGGLDLGPRENFFTFDFAAMDFADPEQNVYRYRLYPLQEEWIEAGNRPTANYTSVPAGGYDFQVAARNSEGVWNEEALLVQIRVQEIFYRTLWFQSLVFFAVLLAITGAYRLRLRQIEARQAERLEIAGRLHDDLGGDLSAIGLKAEVLRLSSGLDETQQKTLVLMGELARNAAQHVREVVWSVNTEYDTLPALVAHMHDTADRLLAGHVDYHFQAPETLPDRELDSRVRGHVYLLYKEALNNALKHADAARIETVVSHNGRILRVRVEDDGCGFDSETVEAGNGTGLMHRRASALGGTIQWSKAPAGGTVVEFTARLR